MTTGRKGARSSGSRKGMNDTGRRKRKDSADDSARRKAKKKDSGSRKSMNDTGRRKRKDSADDSTRRKAKKKDSGSRKSMNDTGRRKRKDSTDDSTRRKAKKKDSGSRKAMNDTGRRKRKSSGSRKGVDDSAVRKGARKSGSRKGVDDSGSRKGARKSGSRKGVDDSAARKGARKSGSRKGVGDSGSRKGARTSGSRKSMSDSGRRRRPAAKQGMSPMLLVVEGLIALALIGGGVFFFTRGEDKDEPKQTAEVEPVKADASTPDPEPPADTSEPEVEAPDPEPPADTSEPAEPADEPDPKPPVDDTADLVDKQASAPIKGDTDTGVVKRVVDGDTLYLEDGRKIRLIGINTPERKSNDPLNEEATQLLRDLVDGKTITLEFDAERTDQFKRTLAHVFIGDVYVNGEIVRQGLAYCYTWKPNTAHEADLAPYQIEARNKGRGLWGLDPPEPAEFYEAGRSAHRFHRPGCKKGPRGRKRTFDTRDECFDEGLNPCSECKP